MTEHPTVDIKVLRQIGWDHWDPIGIRQFNDVDWRHAAADEYDTYLLHAAYMIQKGAALDEAVGYLDKIVSDDMQLGVNEASHHASLRTVEAISAYVLDNGQDS